MARKENIEGLCDFTDKSARVKEYVDYMLNRVNHMFEYHDLPDNISHRSMEHQLMTHGCMCICRIEDDEILNPEGVAPLHGGVYVMWSTPGGVVDLNNELTYMIVAHPRLKQSKQLKINEDCVLLRNDSLSVGLLPMFERYATLLVENDITINMAEIQSRMTALIASGDDNTKASADKFLKDIKEGKLGVILDEGIDEVFKLNVLPYAGNSNNTLTNLIELEQYIKASWFNELGLSANYNMKREAINSQEAQVGQDSLVPLIDDMLHSRQTAWDKANELFGTNVQVEYHRPWALNVDTIEENLPELDEREFNHAADEMNTTKSEESEGSEESDDNIVEKRIQRNASREITQ